MFKKKSVLSILQEKYPDSSTSAFSSWIRQKRITANDFLISSLEDLADPSLLRVLPKSISLGTGVKQLYKDRDIVVVEKPAGLLSVSTDKEKLHTVHAVLKNVFRKKLYPVHRLDKDTSGVMVFAMHKEAQEKFKALFSRHDIERNYMAVVEGVMEEERGVWESYLYEDGKMHVHETKSAQEGKRAITHFEVKGRGKNCTLLKLSLQTGRKNQIRVQAAARGFPLMGDKKYGIPSKKKKRLYLHAYFLAFVHPFLQKKMFFSVPVPSVFGSVVKSKTI